MKYVVIKEEIHDISNFFKLEEDKIRVLASASYRDKFIKITSKKDLKELKDFLYNLPKQTLGKYFEEFGKIILKRNFLVLELPDIRTGIRFNSRFIEALVKSIYNFIIESKHYHKYLESELNLLSKLIENYNCWLDVFVIPKEKNIFQKQFYFVEIKATSKKMTPQLSHKQKEFIKSLLSQKFKEIGVIILSLIPLWNEDKIKIRYIEPKMLKQ